LFRTEGNTTILGLGNLGTLENFGVSLNAQIEVVKWWSTTLHTDVNYKIVNGFTNGANIRTEAANAQFNINNQFSFKKGWAAELSAFYNTKDVEGQFTTKPFGQVSAGFSKQILKNKATVKMNIRDIFFTQTIYGAIEYQNVRENFIQSHDSRVVNISFTYRFGKPLKEARRRSGGASEEQNRVKVG
jgi:iron complex outermembrane receptor protein